MWRIKWHIKWHMKWHIKWHIKWHTKYDTCNIYNMTYKTYKMWRMKWHIKYDDARCGASAHALAAGDAVNSVFIIMNTCQKWCRFKLICMVHIQVHSVTATHCITLQHAAKHCNTPQLPAFVVVARLNLVAGLCMCMCVYVCVCICVFSYLNICLYMCIYMFWNKYKQTYLHTCIHTRM